MNRRFTSVALVWFLISPIAAMADCPNLAGIYAEDDYRIEIRQNDCRFPAIVGGYLLERFQFSNIESDSTESLCFEDEYWEKYCRASWVEHELQIDVRMVRRSDGHESREYLRIIRCDLAKDIDCQYGTVKDEDVVRTRFLGGEGMIPRRK